MLNGNVSDILVLLQVSNGEQSIEFHNESQVVEFLIEWVSAMSARQSNDEWVA